MDSQSATVQNFFTNIRQSFISRDKLDNIRSLVAIITALDRINPQERLFLLKELVNLDFIPHFRRLIISDEVLTKLTLKITLCLMEHEAIFKEYFVDLLKAHFRSFLFMARDDTKNARIIIDCVTFVQMMQERSLNLKIRTKKRPLAVIDPDFYDAFRLSLKKCQDDALKNTFLEQLSVILMSFVRQDDLMKHQDLIFRVISSKLCADSSIMASVMLVRNVLRTKNDENWVKCSVIRIQNWFLEQHSMEIRVFYFYFVLRLIEGKFFADAWIYKNIISGFLGQNGLQYVMEAIKVSIQSNNLLAVYISKQFLAQILSFLDNFLLVDALKLPEPRENLTEKYRKFIFNQRMGLEIWKFDYCSFDFVSEVNFIMCGFEEWKLLITFLYIGVTFGAKIDLTAVFISVVTLIEVAFVQKFDISDRQKRMLMKIYCISFWSTSADIKASLETGMQLADAFLRKFFLENREKDKTLTDCLHSLAYFCQKSGHDEAQSRQMSHQLLQRADLYLTDRFCDIFRGSEVILFELLGFEYITPVLKQNIVATLLKIDLTEEILRKMLRIVFKCKNSALAIDYLPIISQNYGKIHGDQREILNLCYFNHSRAAKNLSRASRVSLMNFFAKALTTAI
ncbi:uncharacterized protein LOC134830856 [Culicoides brevitarsis]|uniref:uncharacterized protein LOC134830856 n=1 Tax=Culicoides brevitarsis TaxID=469753 RepID=UPI00307BCFEF